MKHTFTLMLRFVFMLLVLGTGFTAMAQNANTRSLQAAADRSFENKEYYAAGELYRKVLEKDAKNTYARFQLAESFRNYFDYAAAEVEYAQVVQAKDKEFPLATFWYGKMLKVNGKCPMAITQFTDYLNTQKENKDNRDWRALANVEKEGCELKQAEAMRPVPDYDFSLLPGPVNSQYNDFAPAAWRGDTVLVITSSRTESKGSATDPRLGEMFSDNFVFRQFGGAWSTATNDDGLLKETNTKGNDGAGVFNRERTKFFFNICNTSTDCMIYVTELKDGKWSKAKALDRNVNEPGTFSKQPALSRSGDTLYFVSNRANGKGMNDIWFSVGKGGENFGPAKNMASVNTPFNDMAPTVSPENIFFFASEGHPGFGGLDIFVLSGKEISNVGFPFNSAADDFYFSLTSNKTGFLTSNRDGGLGGDDIYYFDLNATTAPTTLEAILEKEYQQNMLARSTDVSGQTDGDEVTLEDEDGNTLKTTKTDKDGNFAFNNLDKDKDYVKGEGNKVIATKKGEAAGTNKPGSKVKNLNTTASSKRMTRNLFELVYFDFDSDALRPEGKKVLDDLVAYLRTNPDAQVEIKGFTDHTGSEEYNRELARRRVEAANQYLISNNVDNTRLTQVPVGKGSYMAGNSSRQGRQLNRRVEFHIAGGPVYTGGAMAYIPSDNTTVDVVAQKFNMNAQEVRNMNGISGDEIEAYSVVRVKRANGRFTDKGTAQKGAVRSNYQLNR